MLKSILTSIGSALRAVGGVLAQIAKLPLRAVSYVTGIGPGRMPVIDAPSTAEPFVPQPDPEAETRMHMKTALAFQNWAASSAIAGAPLPFPPNIPRAVQEWARGLTRQECIYIVNADKQAVSGHIRNIFLLPSVRRVQPLETARWPLRPAPGPAREPDAGLESTVTPLPSAG